MNKKGIIAIVVIVVLVVLGYVVWGGKGSSEVVNNVPAGEVVKTPVPDGVSKDTFAPVTKDNVDTTLLGRLKVASVAAAETGTRVALVDGKAQFDADGAKGSIALGNTAVEATLGNAKYAFTTIGVTSGGSTYQYAVMFSDVNGTLTDKSYDLVGAGATVTGIRADEISGGLVVTVSFKDAKGATHSKILVVENGAFNPAKTINF